MKLTSLAFIALAGLSLGLTPAPTEPPAYPWGVGEQFEYSGKWNGLNLGKATISVAGIDTVRGVESYVFRFTLDVSSFVYKSSSVLQSWTGTGDLISRRFHQDLQENGKERQRYYEIWPDSGIFRQENRDWVKETPPQPLDDAAFFYFVRTLPLELGKTYSFDRYFKKELNPLTIKVVKREQLELPDKSKVNCLVLQPIIGDDGLFAPHAEAKLWLTDDSRRIPVQIKSKLPFGTVTLRLTSMKLSDPPAATTGP